MRVLMRTVIDYDSPINSRKLKPFEKIKAGFTVSMRKNKWISKRLQTEKDKILQEQNEKDEKVKNDILYKIYQEFSGNSSVSSLGLSADRIYIKVMNEYSDSLYRLFGIKEDGSIDKNINISSDFTGYIIERVKETKDLRTAYNQLPILLVCSRKVVR